MEAVMTAPLLLESAPPADLPADGGEPDAVLVARCQAGQTAPFEKLVTRYRGRIYAMILNLTGNDADAWDLSQEAFLKAWRALPKFEARSQFYTWLYRIAHNVTYDWLRKRKIQGDEFDDNIATRAPAAGAATVPHGDRRPDQNMTGRETAERIQQALQELSPEHRAVILLREVEGMAYEDIAESVGCSMGTVMSRLFYARKRLQELLRDVYEGRES